ncbi:MAG: nucleoside-diphosphate kinase [Thermoplasmata archaeon]|nr:nucleoside-diphosphate kinase [Thermoplasmata archaeon]
MPEGTIERTLVLVKPDGVRRGLAGDLLGRFERKTLKIVAARLLTVTPQMAAKHYEEHASKPFYPGLVTHITSGPVLALALEGRSAIGVVRLMVGATNPQTAAPGTIRGDFGSAVTPNLIHASDSTASAERELALYFGPSDYQTYHRLDAEFA